MTLIALPVLCQLFAVWCCMTVSLWRQPADQLMKLLLAQLSYALLSSSIGTCVLPLTTLSSPVTHCRRLEAICKRKTASGSLRGCSAWQQMYWVIALQQFSQAQIMHTDSAAKHCTRRSGCPYHHYSHWSGYCAQSVVCYAAGSVLPDHVHPWLPAATHPRG